MDISFVKPKCSQRENIWQSVPAEQKMFSSTNLDAWIACTYTCWIDDPGLFFNLGLNALLDLQVAVSQIQRLLILLSIRDVRRN